MGREAVMFNCVFNGVDANSGAANLTGLPLAEPESRFPLWILFRRFKVQNLALAMLNTGL